MYDKLQYFSLGAVLILCAIAWTEYSNDRMREYARVYDCVIEQANIQGYAGNVYSRDAWDAFAPNCK